MTTRKRKASNLHSRKDNNQSWAFKRCALTAAIASALTMSSVYAEEQGADLAEDQQDETSQAVDEEDLPAMEEVVVTSMRQNLESAQMLKRTADTVVDSITAEDLGSFPDKSIAEALQRVAGVTVNRFAASSDTAHFSAEPSGVIVRGLNMVRTEFNGRDTFSANSSRGLSWGDVSPELMAGVDTYKNQMAELIEGGIAGSVNMRTRLPFDQADQTLAVSLGANYGDLSEKFTPEVSALFSDRWDTRGGGEWGLMVNAAYSHVETRTEGLQLYRMTRYRDVYQPGLVYIPSIVKANENTYDRKRNGVSAALQWANADDTVIASVQYNRSEYKNAWEEYLIQTSPADVSFGQSVFYEAPGQDPNGGYNQDATNPIPLPGTAPFTFNDQGLFQTGVMTVGSGWWGNDNNEAAGFARNAAGQNMVNACYGWNGCEPTLRGLDTAATTRSNNNENKTQDISFNLKWSITENVRTNFDVQHVDSTVENYDIDMAFWTFAVANIDLSGGRPRFTLSDPINVNQSPGGFENPNNYYIRSIMDHYEDSEGDQLAVRADMEVDLSHSWLDSVKFGLRYADRDQTVRWTTYNWQNVANTWTGNDQYPYFNIDNGADTSGLTNFQGYPQDLTQVRTLDNIYGGGYLSPQTFVFGNMGFMQNQQAFANAMSEEALGIPTGRGWDPICSNRGDRGGEIPGTCFTPAEISDVSETTEAAYLQLNFGGEEANLFGIPFSGNIGVRYVKTNNASTGGIVYPMLNQSYFFERIDNGDGTYTDNPLPRAYENLGCYENQGTPENPNPSVPLTMGCYITQEDYNFMDGANELNATDVDHDHWLPSFNIKFDMTEELLLRFAWSRAMSRPDIGNMKNFVNVGSTLPDNNDATDPLWVKDGNGEIVSADVRYTGSAQNPFLKPVIADQWDISLEWYFAEVGSLTATYFNKKFDDYIQFGTYNREVTNGGVTQTAEIRGPLNGEGAKINGFELAYQSFFDFLPSPFDGLGVQANYTHINNKGITNTNVSTVGDGTVITGQAPDAVQVDVLEGLSEDSYTVIGMYEKGDWSARLAYSWRSEFMVTAVDCCVAVPIWNEDYGQLDGSLRWRVTDSIELGISGSNLTNTETVLRQQVQNSSDGGLTMPASWFQNDRRYTLTFRYFR